MTFFEGLKRATSDLRLQSYRVRGYSDEQLVARYVWNTALREALLPSLQHLEVALRNSLHTALSSEYSTPEWYDREPSFLHLNEVAKLNDAKQTILSDGKFVESDRVVAALNFGFWTSLLDSRYEQSPKNTRGIWPRLLRSAFPVMPNTVRTRLALSGRLNSIRKLRNSVFHNEPIWNIPDLINRHQEILQTLKWLNFELHALVTIHDRFGSVHEAGEAAYHTLVDRLFRGQEA